MKEIIICVGISGSGKSTWTTNFIKENPNYLRINRDAIRLTLVGNLDGYYQRSDLNNVEKVVSFTEDDIFDNNINRGYNIIIDNTNLKQSYINKWLESIENINIINHGKYDFKFKIFDCNTFDSKLRVAEREYRHLNNITTLLTIKYKEELKYIDKQYLQYQRIKKWIETNYKDKII